MFQPYGYPDARFDHESMTLGVNVATSWWHRTSTWHTLTLQLCHSALATILMHLNFSLSYSASNASCHVTAGCVKAPESLTAALRQASTNRHCMLPAVLLCAYTLSYSYSLLTYSIAFLNCILIPAAFTAWFYVFEVPGQNLIVFGLAAAH